MDNFDSSVSFDACTASPLPHVWERVAERAINVHTGAHHEH